MWLLTIITFSAPVACESVAFYGNYAKLENLLSSLRKESIFALSAFNITLVSLENSIIVGFNFSSLLYYPP